MPTIFVNGVSIAYPDVGDSNWGTDATNFAIQVAAALGKIGQSAFPPTNDITVSPGNLSVTSGNLSVGGDASVTGNTTLTGNITVNGNSNLGNGTSDTTAITGILNVDSGVLYVDPTTNKVGINDATPSVELDVNGSVAITGNETVGGTLGVTGDVSVNTNKFNVTASSGNTTIAGSLDVSGVFNQMPTGTIITSALQTNPSGFLLCDGSNTVSRSTYLNLFNAIVPNKGTVTITINTPGVVTLNSHGFLTGESIFLNTTGALPTGLSIDTLYFVISIDANTFRLATSYSNSIAGTAINTSGSQSGTHTLFFCPYGLGSNTSNFKLPDFKNATIRGRGLSSGFTNNNTTRMGFLENDSLQGHRHEILSQGTWRSGNLLVYGPSTITSTTVPELTTVASQTNNNMTNDPGNDGTNGTPRISLETRMKNQGVNFFIKF